MEVIQFNDCCATNFSHQFVVTIGMFDGVHIGHKTIIEKLVSEAKKANAIPAVITFSQHPRLILGQDAESLELLSSQKEKFRLLDLLHVEKVFVIEFTKEFAGLSTAGFVKRYLVESLHIKGLILGYDNHFGNKKSNDFSSIFELAKQYDFFVKTTEPSFYNGITVSSTQIRKALKNGEIPLANKMLGYRYSIEGEVINGEKIGRALGFPTANLEPIEKHLLIPSQGIYAALVQCNGEALKGGMLNIGTRPTFGEHQQSLEVHIFDFSKNIYGQNIILFFVEKIREEKKFSSAEELAEQLKKDKKFISNKLKPILNSET